MNRDVCEHFNPVDLPCAKCEEKRKSEALFLADELEIPLGTVIQSEVCRRAAKELRRLHAELERCKQVCAATSEAWRQEAALAEPVEPVAWRYVPSDVWGAPIVTQDPKTVELARQYGRPIEPLYTSPPQRKPEPVQEPVAWIHTDPDKPRVKFLEWREDEPGYRGDWIKTPLYAAPPQRKPLTEEEIWRTYKNLWMFHPAEEPRLASDVLKFARAIERAHGIGGNDVGT